MIVKIVGLARDKHGIVWDNGYNTRLKLETEDFRTRTAYVDANKELYSKIRAAYK